jgi:hypothetical protein
MPLKRQRLGHHSSPGQSTESRQHCTLLLTCCLYAQPRMHP